MCDLDSVIINLKACLVSTKNGIPLNQIESEYFKLNGEKIPFRGLGFSSLENLLRSSGKFAVTNSGGQSIVQALATNKTQHLTDLIKRQKSKPPKKKPFISSYSAPRKYNTTSSFSKPNYSQGISSSNYGKSRNNYRGTTISKSHKPTFHRNNVPNPSYTPQSVLKDYSCNTKNYGNQQSNFKPCLPETKTCQQSILLNNDGEKDTKSVSSTNGTHQQGYNGKSYNKLEQNLPLTSSCSSLESTYSSGSANYTPKPTIINPDKFQLLGNAVNNTNDTNSQIPKTSIYVQEKFSEPSFQQHTMPVTKLPSIQNLSIKPSTAQSRLQKYPKKCDDTLIKVDGKEYKSRIEEQPVQFTDLRIEVKDTSEIIDDDQDYIVELESYLKNLNLFEPQYECMVKKEKYGKTLKLTHICTIKVNEKNISSSFPVDCSTVENAKKVAAKHALTTLKKQYGENVIYPITSDVNNAASRIKNILKLGFKGTGIISDVLERMYREEFKENLPDNWVQLLGVYGFFTIDKLFANKIIIYLNEVENSQDVNSYKGANGYIEAPIEELNLVPGTPLKIEDYEEKSVLVSANYGSANVWVRFVGQNADEHFIEMQAKLNDTMNTNDVNMPDQVIEGEFYAVLYNSSWHRVQVYGPTDDTTVTCFMIDTGEELNIEKNQICCLEPVFMKTKTQAIHCVLTQLDKFDSFYGLKQLLDKMILNKTFFLIPDSLTDLNNVMVTLYEKSGVDRLNVNDMIIQQVLKNTEAKLPSFEDNVILDAYLSSIDDTGHVNLQLNSEVVSSLEEIMPSDDNIFPEYFLKSKEDVVKDKVYLIKYETENVWSRVHVLEIIKDNEAKIIYIDYGNIEKCEITKLANLDMYDSLMAMIPPQAIKASMNLIPPSEMTLDIANKILEITGNDKVLVNLINAPTNDVPCIQLYKMEPDTPDIPLCINILLAQRKRITNP